MKTLTSRDLASSRGDPREGSDFRVYLQNELIRRCKANPQYSLRAFAKSLDVDVSLLSKILRGLRAVSKGLFSKLSRRLGLGPVEIKSFEESLKSPASSDQASLPAVSYQNLTLDYFHLISDWYHYALFELITISSFESSPKWIAKTLSITISEANITIERMIRLELLRWTEDHRLVRTTDHITTVGNDFTAIALRRLQKQVLQMGIHALEELPMEIRDQSSMTMAISSKRFPEIKNRIKRFRRELCEFVEKDKERDQVYQLGICFYPLTIHHSKERKNAFR